MSVWCRVDGKRRFGMSESRMKVVNIERFVQHQDVQLGEQVIEWGIHNRGMTCT